MKTTILQKTLWLFSLIVLMSFSSYAQTFKISPRGSVTLCSGETLKISAASGYVRYSWSTRSTDQSIKVNQSGVYVCTATDKAGKTYSDSVKVNVVKPIVPQYKYDPSSTICKGDSITISITNQFKEFNWSNNTTKSSVTLKPTVSGKIGLLVTDSNGCKYEKNIEYTVKDCSNSSSCDSILEKPKTTILCGSKDSIILEVKSGFSFYLWNDGDKNRVKTIKRAGTYIIKVQDKAGNYCYDTITIQGGTAKLEITATKKEICKGDTVTLTASEGFKSYKWSTKSNDRKIKVSPIKSTNYLMIATDSFGCEYIEDIQITVKSCDDCDDLIGSSKRNLCSEKDTVIIEAKSGFKSYNWSTGSNDRVIKVTKKGWYILTAKTEFGKECKDSIYIGLGAKKLSAFSNPSPAVVCPNDKVVIEVTEGFKSYWWNTGNRGDRAELYLKETKTVVIEALDSNGCESRVEIKVTVKDTCDKNKCPDIIEAWPKNSLCSKNDSIKLLANSGYTNYKWNTGSDNRIIWIKEKGWYWINFKDKNGNECRDSIYIGSGSSKKLEIEIVPGKPYCIGDTVFAKASTGFKSYSWNTGSSDRIIELILTARKVLVVEALDENGCEARKQIVIEADTCNSSITNFIKSQITVTPNPADNYININSPLTLKNVSLKSINGKVMRDIVESAGNNNMTIDLSEIPSGIYFLSIEAQNHYVYYKIIKQ